MAIMRGERRASGSVGSTWPSAARAARPVARHDHLEEAGDESIPAGDAPSRTLAPSNAAPSSTQYEPATRGEPSTRREERVALLEVEVMDVNEIPEGEARTVEVDGHEITLCKLGDEVFALSGACSYHPIPLRGAKLEGEVLTCRWYGAQFDVRTGESVFLRSVQPLVTYPTAVRAGRVFVQVPLAPAEPGSRWVGAER